MTFPFAAELFFEKEPRPHTSDIFHRFIGLKIVCQKITNDFLCGKKNTDDSKLKTHLAIKHKGLLKEEEEEEETGEHL